jgi:hypothetical protein
MFTDSDRIKIREIIATDDRSLHRWPDEMAAAIGKPELAHDRAFIIDVANGYRESAKRLQEEADELERYVGERWAFRT